uniref:Uncharacterized protein n=1 Tax=Meloidogyne hapla TaxID=6305 RepID=A0A1I8B571_MELHA
MSKRVPLKQKDISQILRHLKLNPNNHSQGSTNNTQQIDMECDPPQLVVGIATTESSAPPAEIAATPTTEPTTNEHPRIQPPSPTSTNADNTEKLDIPLPPGPPPLSALKLPQRYNICSRVRILDSGSIQNLPIDEHTIKKNQIKKWEMTRKKKLSKRITITKPNPLNKIYINPNYVANLLIPPPPPPTPTNTHNSILNTSMPISSAITYVPVIHLPIVPYQILALAPGMSRNVAN